MTGALKDIGGMSEYRETTPGLGRQGWVPWVLGCLLGALVFMGCGSGGDASSGDGHGGVSGAAGASGAAGHSGAAGAAGQGPASSLSLSEFSVSPSSVQKGGLFELSFEVFADGLAAPRESLDFTILVTNTDRSIEDFPVGGVKIPPELGGTVPDAPRVVKFSNLTDNVITYSSVTQASVTRTLQVTHELTPGRYELDLIRDTVRYRTGLVLEVTEATRPDLVVSDISFGTNSVQLYANGTSRSMYLRSNIIDPEHDRPALLFATVEVANLGAPLGADAELQLSGEIRCDGDPTHYALAIAAETEEVLEPYFGPGESFGWAGAVTENTVWNTRAVSLAMDGSGSEIQALLLQNLDSAAYDAFQALVHANSGGVTCDLTYTVRLASDLEVSAVGSSTLQLLPETFAGGAGSSIEGETRQSDWVSLYDIESLWPGAESTWGSLVSVGYDFTPNYLKYKNTTGSVPWAIDFGGRFQAGFAINGFGVKWEKSLVDISGSGLVDGDTLSGERDCNAQVDKIEAEAMLFNQEVFSPVSFVTCFKLDQNFSVSKAYTASYPVAGFSIAGVDIGLQFELSAEMGIKGTAVIQFLDERTISATTTFGPEVSISASPVLGLGVAEVTGELALIGANLIANPSLTIHWFESLLPAGGEISVALPLSLESLEGEVKVEIGVCPVCKEYTIASMDPWDMEFDLYSNSWQVGTLSQSATGQGATAERPGVIPGGPWSANCTYKSFEDGLLTATCLDSSGTPQETSEVGCETFNNTNGDLQCERRYKLPGGPWQEECTVLSGTRPNDAHTFPIRGVEVCALCPADTGTLEKSCMAGCLEMENDNGVLTCTGDIPGGNWGDSCDNAAILFSVKSGDVLSARCSTGRHPAQKKGVTAVLADCPGERFDYMGGRLVCLP